MKLLTFSLTKKVAYMRARMLLLVLVTVAGECSSKSVSVSNAGNSASRRKIVLEVINRHFTVGKKIKSVYLRVFSDGTAECHTEKYWNEPDIVKKKALNTEDFAALRGVLEQPELLQVKPRYELMYHVIDSWVEWEIRIPHSHNAQTIEVAGFAPWAAKQRNEPYPDALLKLGCTIWKTRSDVYGDEGSANRSQTEECKRALGVH